MTLLPLPFSLTIRAMLDAADHRRKLAVDLQLGRLSLQVELSLPISEHPALSDEP